MAGWHPVRTDDEHPSRTDARYLTVERTIVKCPGTGGSAGVAYLRPMLFRPAFPDQWAVRNRL